MELCVNYTAEVKELFEEGKIDFIDYFKLYSINNDLTPFDWCADHKKVMFHGMLGKSGANIASESFLQGRDFSLQAKYYQRSHCPHISFHMDVASGEEPKSEAETIQVIQHNIHTLNEKYAYPILLENIPIKAEKPQYHFLAEPHFIGQVLEETETYFLLDTSHAKKTATVFAIPFMEYIQALPLDKVREVHLSGCEWDNAGNIYANHSEMKEEDYELLAYLLQHCPNLNVLTLEYGPYDIQTHFMIPTYDKVDVNMKETVYQNLLKLKEVMEK